MKNYKPECLIFDMDGTLWDATESYATIWNEASQIFNYSKIVTSAELIQHMGKPLDEILRCMFGNILPFDIDSYLAEVAEIEKKRMPKLGGILFPGVAEYIPQLANKFTLMMLSNCGEGGLDNFLDFTGLKKYFTDWITFGESPVPKSINMEILLKRNHLTSGLYIGDTQGDCNETHKAQLPFAFMKYGFGKCSNADIEFDSFQEFAQYYLKQD